MMSMRSFAVVLTTAMLWQAAAAQVEPLVDLDRQAAGGGAASAPAGPTQPAGELISDDELRSILESMTPEELEQLIQKAAQERLKFERRQVVAEIRQGLLYEPDDIDAAVAILERQPVANTQRDNIDRVCLALAKVDKRFGEAFSLFNDGKFDKAAELAKASLDPQQTTYLSAARYYVCGQALAKAGKLYDAAETYLQLMENMPDRVGFASAAGAAAAEAYESLGRQLYAAEVYAHCLMNYALTLDKDQAEAMFKRVKELQEIYKDPLGTLARRMGAVEQRLGKSDSGKETQKKEQEIVALLDDLIKTAEEKQNSQGQGQGQGRGKGKRPGQGQGQGQSQGQGTARSGPRGNQQPSSPAQVSALVPGETVRPTKLSEIHKIAEAGDWSTLPPREREKLQDAARKVLAERYRDIVSDYHSTMARQKPD